MSGSAETPFEPRFRGTGPELESLLSEWRALGRECLREIEAFTRERPTEGLTLAFLVGAVLGVWLGRR